MWGFWVYLLVFIFPLFLYKQLDYFVISIVMHTYTIFINHEDKHPYKCTQMVGFNKRKVTYVNTNCKKGF